MYTTASELTTKLRFNNPEYYKQLELLTSIPALIIEDLGGRQSEYNQEQLELVLEQRERVGLRTIVTSESEPEELGYKVQLERRLKRMQRTEL